MTKNLKFCKGRIQDADKMFDNFLGQAETAKYLLWKPAVDKDYCARWVAKTLEYAKNHDYFYIYEKATNEPIGYVSAENLGGGEWGNVAICIGKNFTRKGYGSEALKFLLQYIKNKGGKKVVYSHLKGNIASQKLAEKFGFTYTETKPREVPKDNTVKDELFYILDLK